MKRTQQHRPGLTQQAQRVTASARPPGVTISRMDTLRRRGEPDEAVAFLRESLVADPAAAVGLLALLRAAARLDDARILLELARNGGPALCSQVAQALSDAGATDDAQYLFGALEQLDLGTVISVVAPLDHGHDAATPPVSDTRAPRSDSKPHHPEPSQSTNPMLDVLLRHPVDEFVSTIAQLRNQQRPDEARTLLDILCQASPEKAVAIAQGLAQRGLMQDAHFAIDSYAIHAGPFEAATAFVALARFWPDAAAVNAMAIADRQDAVVVIRTLDDLGRRHQGARPLAELVRMLPAKSVARLCHALCSEDTYDQLDAILTQCAMRADRDELCMALYELDLHSAAYHLAQRAHNARPARTERAADEDWRPRPR